MQNYEEELELELEHLSQVKSYIEELLSEKQKSNKDSKSNIISFRKEMWNNSSSSLMDFDQIIDMNQHLQELNMQTEFYVQEIDEIQKLELLNKTPYFARIDFMETDFDAVEKIYIGRSSLMSENGRRIIVYDWRSPISSIFYRHELGAVEYQAPGGTITGKMWLKRQFEIQNGNLEYFFDASVQITDQFLRKLLSKNASQKMTAIVETIQKDQDQIIRDSNTELLMVQGVAGSGKTSVALHRVAYLMYNGLANKLNSNNVIIISPNPLFETYISNVLPELGENNVQTLVFENIIIKILGNKAKFQSYNQYLERLITCKVFEKKELMKASLNFKVSNNFMIMLERLIAKYEHNMIDFTNLYYNHKIIFDRFLLRERLIKRDSNVSIASRLKLIENIILQNIRKEKEKRLLELENFISENFREHAFEVKECARMLSIKENGVLVTQIHKFTRIDYYRLYKTLFQNKTLFYNMAKELDLPKNIEDIRLYTIQNFKTEKFKYEDALAVSYLKIGMSDCNMYKDIRQVIVDEAQDYYPMHYKVLKLLFPQAKYTILGDVYQTIEKNTSVSHYENIKNILAKKSPLLCTLSKSFRCTHEIIQFSHKFVDKNVEIESFSRNGAEPELISCNPGSMSLDLIQIVDAFKKEGYNTIGIICKSSEEAFKLFGDLKDSTDIYLVDENYVDNITGAFIIPIYMAKGLEFDAVIIYNVDVNHYNTPDDKNLLYIASTRALHRLTLLYEGKCSRFLC